MKKITLYLIATCLLLSFNPLQSKAATTDPPASIIVVKPEVSAEAKALLLRLDEINTMDKTNLKSAEKKNLRMEVRVIERQLNGLSDGLYLSIGAIIILLLLIILL